MLKNGYDNHYFVIFQNKTMLGSYIQQSIFGANTPMPAVLSYYQHQKEPFRLPVSIKCLVIFVTQ